MNLRKIELMCAKCDSEEVYDHFLGRNSEEVSKEAEETYAPGLRTYVSTRDVKNAIEYCFEQHEAKLLKKLKEDMITLHEYDMMLELLDTLKKWLIPINAYESGLNDGCGCCGG